MVEEKSKITWHTFKKENFAIPLNEILSSRFLSIIETFQKSQERCVLTYRKTFDLSYNFALFIRITSNAIFCFPRR